MGFGLISSKIYKNKMVLLICQENNIPNGKIIILLNLSIT